MLLEYQIPLIFVASIPNVPVRLVDGVDSLVVELKCIITVNGEPFVMMNGVFLIQKLFVAC